MRFAARLLGDEDAARDVVQHAFLRLCEQSPEQLNERVARWLFTVCRNKAVDVLRTRQRNQSLGERGEPACVGKEPDPADATERQELYRRLNGLVDRLPPSQREALGLWSEGFSYREIADIVDTSQGHVRVLVHRAIKHLRSQPIARELLGMAAETLRPSPREPTEFV